MNLNLNFRRAESFYMLLFLALGGLLFQQSFVTKVPYPETLPARVYGMIISALFIVVVVTRLVALICKKEGQGAKLTMAHARMILIAALLILAYTVGIVKIGYYVMTFLYTTGMIMLLRERKERTPKAWIITVLGCLVFDAALYAVFSTFHVFLPNAWLI